MKPGKLIKKIGIVGGTAWPSTVVYYSELCRRTEQWLRSRDPEAGSSTAEMMIESLNLGHVLSCLGVDGDEASWSRFDAYHRDALKHLEACGAEVALIASNTGHHRFEAIVDGIGIPVVSILDAAARECARLGASQALILGTALVMKSAKFREGFSRYGIQAAGPRDDAARAATVELITELQLGSPAEAAKRVGTIAKTSFQAQFTGQPVVCLACTELPLAFEASKTLATFEYDGVSYINTMAAHINAVFDFATA